MADSLAEQLEVGPQHADRVAQLVRERDDHVAAVVVDLAQLGVEKALAIHDARIDHDAGEVAGDRRPPR